MNLGAADVGLGLKRQGVSGFSKQMWVAQPVAKTGHKYRNGQAIKRLNSCKRATINEMIPTKASVPLVLLTKCNILKSMIACVCVSVFGTRNEVNRLPSPCAKQTVDAACQGRVDETGE